MITIVYHVRPRSSHPAQATYPTQVMPRHHDRVLRQWADHVRREFGASTTRETAWRRLPDGSYEVWKRQKPGGLHLATLTLTP